MRPSRTDLITFVSSAENFETTVQRYYLGETGFKPEFMDIGQHTPGDWVDQTHILLSKADVALNAVSVPLGVNLTPRKEELVSVGDRGGWRRIPANPGYKGLAAAIRARVCE